MLSLSCRANFYGTSTVTDLKRAAQDVEESHECFLAQNRVFIQNITAELEATKSELREKDKDIEEFNRKESSLNEQIEGLQTTVAVLEEQIASKSGELSLLQQTNAEKALLSEQLSKKEHEVKLLREELLSNQGDILAMQEKIDYMSEREHNLEKREHEMEIRLAELRKTRAAEEAKSEAIAEVQNLRETLSQNAEKLAKVTAIADAKVCI